ncbi:hypothetical protein [Streptomyces sp. NPDC059010]|uniref:hypothetical protein n=1 Tax=Streptomyces sp. NPDC059010 TaxID=3346695 RepID=UPI0036C9ADEE
MDGSKIASFASSAAAIVAVILSVISLVSRRTDRREAERLREADQREARRESVVRALLGEKESVAYEAYSIIEHGWSTMDDEGNRDRLNALCLAAVFERSDRAKSLIFRALDNYPQKREIKEVIDKLMRVFDRYYDQKKREDREVKQTGTDRLQSLERAIFRNGSPGEDSSCGGNKETPSAETGQD